MTPRLIQFNWRRQWSGRVAPYLGHDLVQLALDMGMMALRPKWRRGDPPFLLGGIPPDGGRVVPGKLSWYRVWNRCHWIAFFSMSIGVLNYPQRDWRFISGGLHTVPVGYDPTGDPRVVMDILLFDTKTAEESIAFARPQTNCAPASPGWNQLYQAFRTGMVPRLRETAEALRGKKGNTVLDT